MLGGIPTTHLPDTLLYMIIVPVLPNFFIYLYNLFYFIYKIQIYHNSTFPCTKTPLIFTHVNIHISSESDQRDCVLNRCTKSPTKKLFSSFPHQQQKRACIKIACDSGPTVLLNDKGGNLKLKLKPGLYSMTRTM